MKFVKVFLTILFVLAVMLAPTAKGQVVNATTTTSTTTTTTTPTTTKPSTAAPGASTAAPQIDGSVTGESNSTTDEGGATSGGRRHVILATMGIATMSMI
eukprot:GHVU01000135.1.p1 GENE.GHVU01000135.1~~GHVU01000135.1.p1  ORF type:complete len:100 (+),score=15.80 GHVU01000135.1:28-327(+)